MNHSQPRKKIVNTKITHQKLAFSGWSVFSIQVLVMYCSAIINQIRTAQTSKLIPTSLLKSQIDFKICNSTDKKVTIDANIQKIVRRLTLSHQIFLSISGIFILISLNSSMVLDILESSDGVVCSTQRFSVDEAEKPVGQVVQLFGSIIEYFR